MPVPLPVVIAIEGNIGVGKSTQIRRLQQLFEDNDRVVVLPEPVDEWVDKGFLQGMYDGTISKGEFQHMVLMSLAGDLLKALAVKPTPAVIITERSPWGARRNTPELHTHFLYPFPQRVVFLCAQETSTYSARRISQARRLRSTSTHGSACLAACHPSSTFGTSTSGPASTRSSSV